jgi:hypothetical protein
MKKFAPYYHIFLCTMLYICTATVDLHAMRWTTAPAAAPALAQPVAPTGFFTRFVQAVTKNAFFFTIENHPFLTTATAIIVACAATYGLVPTVRTTVNNGFGSLWRWISSWWQPVREVAAPNWAAPTPLIQELQKRIKLLQELQERIKSRHE